MSNNFESTNSKIDKLRKLMSEKGIDVYIVPTSDPHGFGYVDEGLTKEQALAKLKLEMQNNPAFQYFLSTLPKEKRASVVKEIVDAVIGSNESQKLIENLKK